MNRSTMLLFIKRYKRCVELIERRDKLDISEVITLTSLLTDFVLREFVFFLDRFPHFVL